MPFIQSNMDAPGTLVFKCAAMLHASSQPIVPQGPTIDDMDHHREISARYKRARREVMLQKHSDDVHARIESSAVRQAAAIKAATAAAVASIEAASAVVQETLAVEPMAPVQETDGEIGFDDAILMRVRERHALLETQGFLIDYSVLIDR